jgi:hypothetical protein
LGKDEEEWGEDNDDCPPLILNDEENEIGEDEDEGEGEDSSHDDSVDDPDNEIDELQILDDIEKEVMLNGTSTARDTITKVGHHT